MFRSLHAEFLRDTAELLDDADLRELAGIYQELATSWVNLAAKAELEDHAGGTVLVSDIREAEHLGVSLMEKWLVKAGT